MQCKALKRGYTMIEMTLVVLLLGIIFSVATVRFDSLTNNSRLRASAREIGSTVAVAYSEAMVRKTKQIMVFDTERGSFWIATDDDPEGLAGAGFLSKRYLYRGVTFRDIQVGEELFEEAGELKIDISPLGISTSCFIHLINEQETEMTVQVHPLTGTVTYHEGYVEFEDENEGFDFAE
jgi:prepilin-type N-terminal cleavage/methylation domain-containing protein